MSKNRFHGKYHEKHSTLLPGAEQFLGKMTELASVKVVNGGKIVDGIKTQKQITLFSDGAKPTVTCTYFNDRAKQVFYFVPNGQGFEAMFRDLFEHCTEYAEKNGFSFESIPVPSEIKKIKESEDMKNGVNLNPGITYFGGLKTDWSDTAREMLMQFRGGDSTGAMSYARALTQNLETKDKKLASSHEETEALRRQLASTFQTHQVGINEIMSFLSAKVSDYFVNLEKAQNERNRIAKFLGGKVEKRKSLISENDQLTTEIADLRKKLVESAISASSHMLMDTASQINQRELAQTKIGEKLAQIEDTTEYEQKISEVSTIITEMESLKVSMVYFQSVVQTLNEFQVASDKEVWWEKQINTFQMPITTKPTPPAKINANVEGALRNIDDITVEQVMGKGTICAPSICGLERNTSQHTVSLMIKALSDDIMNGTDKLTAFLQQMISYSGKITPQRAVATPDKIMEVRNQLLKLGFVKDDGSIDCQRIFEVYKNHRDLGHLKRSARK